MIDKGENDTLKVAEMAKTEIVAEVAEVAEREEMGRKAAWGRIGCPFL